MSTANYREVEIKLVYSGTAQQAQALIEGRGYVLIESRTLESDQLFDRAGELRSSDQLLRLRRAGERATVTYKGPGLRERHKNREEIEFDVTGAKELALVLGRLGYQPAFRYEKYRTKFAASDEPGIVTIDETPMGVYLEIEGPPDWIDHTAHHLGYAQKDYVTASYSSLYRKFRETNPDAPVDMIFHT
jgi:adenylate cyclase class 2